MSPTAAMISPPREALDSLLMVEYGLPLYEISTPVFGVLGNACLSMAVWTPEHKPNLPSWASGHGPSQPHLLLKHSKSGVCTSLKPAIEFKGMTDSPRTLPIAGC